MSSKIPIFNSTKSSSDKGAVALMEAIDKADTIVIGAGAGLSTSAGAEYSGERFRKYFSDFADKYGFEDMYSGGFYPFGSLEEKWAYWSRYIYINRFLPPSKPVFEDLLKLVKDKDYFVITTNVDHNFQKAGFDKDRLFYTQGDYGLLQCSEPCHSETYDNEETIKKMVESQGFVIDEKTGELTLPNGVTPKMEVPSELIPVCPKCGKPMQNNLRADQTFVEDEGWNNAAQNYIQFLEKHQNDNILFLELGVGFNTPSIIKYPFWRMASEFPKATYAAINFGEMACPKQIIEKSICLNKDIGEVLRQVVEEKSKSK